MSPSPAADPELWARLRKAEPDLADLSRLAGSRDVRCADWPAIWGLLVELIGPCRNRGGDPILFTMAAFDAAHDLLWSRVGTCRRVACPRCRPYDPDLIPKLRRQRHPGRAGNEGSERTSLLAAAT